MRLDHSRLPALLDDLEAAVREMKAALGDDGAAWTRAPAGKWTPGQHVEHVAKNLEVMAERFETGARELREGRLAPPPRHGFLEGLFVRLLMREPFPRGGRAPDFVSPGPTCSRDAIFRRLDAGAARHRALCDRLTPEERERIWIVNPFMEARRWHYRLFEAVRVQTTHARHHTRLAREAAARA
jgi:hypothetical protein